MCVLHSLQRHRVCTAQSRETLCVYCTVYRGTTTTPPPPWALRSVQSLSACIRVHFYHLPLLSTGNVIVQYAINCTIMFRPYQYNLHWPSNSHSAPPFIKRNLVRQSVTESRYSAARTWRGNPVKVPVY